jgi:parallel beta-helix repeat protein
MKRRQFFNLLGLSWLGTIVFPLFARQLLALANTTKSIDFYVSPQGDDRNSGTQKLPFATIEAARNAIRKLKQQQGNNLQQPVNVFLRDGTYKLNSTLTFTPEDSGTKDYPIAYRAYRNEKPMISGGKTLSGWRKTTTNGKQMWLLEIPEVKQGTWYFRQLWFDGELRRRARYPHQGYLKVEVATAPEVEPPLAPGPYSLNYYAGDLQAWRTIDRADVVIANYWAESRMPATKIDLATRTLHFSKPSTFRLEDGNNKTSGSAVYYLENILEVLEHPGEWFLDNKSGKLYYLPKDGETPDNVGVIAPVLSQLVELQGNLDKNQLVENIRFEGITFAHTNWYYANDYHAGGYGQAVIHIPSAIHGRGITNCTWYGCTIAHLANHAIEFSQTAYNNRVDRCDMFDLGAGGIKISATLDANNQKVFRSEKNIINRCNIHDGGTLFHGAVAIWLAYTDNNRIINNNIYHFYYSGISVGWDWGYQGATTDGTTIENNRIHHIGKKEGESVAILNDKGGIYTLGRQKNSVIRGNLIHDIDSLYYGAWGIYLDEGSSEITISNNLVYRTLSGGFHLHYGRDNRIINNIFALGKLAQLKRSRGENHRSFTFEKNIIYWKEGELAEGNWDKGETKCDRNIYWNAGEGKINFGQWSWEQWQAKGEDRRSLIADPLFVNPEGDDFTIQKTSPAWKLGFRKILSG